MRSTGADLPPNFKRREESNGMSEEKTYLPSLEETTQAFYVATQLMDLIEQFASTAKFEAHTLIALGSALYELEVQIIGTAATIEDRWFELEELLRIKNKHPELSTFANYYVEFNGKDDAETVHHFERDPETEEVR